MPVTAKTADYNVTVDTTGGNLFTSLQAGGTNGAPCVMFWVRHISNVGGDVLQVNVPGLHAAAEYVPLDPDTERTFVAKAEAFAGRIASVFAKARTGTSQVSWGIVGK